MEQSKTEESCWTRVIREGEKKKKHSCPAVLLVVLSSFLLVRPKMSEPRLGRGGTWRETKPQEE